MCLRAERISKAFGGVVALSDLSLRLSGSNVVAVVGPNGAGKTTLLHILTGYLRPDHGSCHVGELNITNRSPYRIARAGISRTFQDPRLVRDNTTLDNMLLAIPGQREGLLAALWRVGLAREHRANRRKALEILRFVGLEGQADQTAGDLSYGQQKLLTLGACLATDAQILLLDEPIAGVHPEIAQQILEIFRRLRNEGKLVVFIEHDLAAVREVADEVVVMDHGQVIARGRPPEVLDQPMILEAYIA